MPESIARLVELHDGRPSRVHTLGVGVHLLGRDASADVTLDHAGVSHHHAELEITDAGGRLRDLGSKNGIKISGAKVEDAALEHGSRFAFGDLGLMLEHDGTRVDRLLAHNGEATVRRPRAPEAQAPPASRAPTPQPSLLLPSLAALAFTILLLWLLVGG